MTFKEIVNRITGISIPIFGLSWNPPILEQRIVEKIMTFLEDKRVLYNPYEMENPEYCKQSVCEIREFLTQQLFDVNRNSHLYKTLDGMRIACRNFLNIITENSFAFNFNGNQLNNNLEISGQILFFSGIGELRGTFGFLIAELLIKYKIDCSDELSIIIPLRNIEEDDFA